MTLDPQTTVLIRIFTKQLDFFLNTMDIGNGVTVGFIIIGVGLIGMVISTILSRPIAVRLPSGRGEKEHERNEWSNITCRLVIWNTDQIMEYSYKSEYIFNDDGNTITGCYGN